MDNMDWDKIGFDDVITQQEQSVLLNNLTDELLLENIYEQVDTPFLDLYDPTNYIEVFESRYKFLNMRFKDVPDFLSELNDVRRSFFINVLDRINKKFRFTIDSESETMYVITRVLYQFFILEYKQNVRTFIIEYIQENKKSLVASFDDGSKNLDLIAMKKTFKNKNDAIIMSNIYRIIDLIIKQELPAKNILDLITRVDPSESVNYFIDMLITNDELVTEGDFSKIFFKVLIQKGEGSTKIINEIQMELFNIFPRKLEGEE
jgi:hypothetical protein